MKRLIVAVCFLILGIGIGFWIASHRPKVVTMVFSNVGDLLLAPNPGDVVTWTNGGQPVPVTFKRNANPCKAGDPVGTCTIQATVGVFPYNCAGCPDPGIGVGSDVFNAKATAAGISPSVVPGILPPPYAMPKGPQITCDSGTGKAVAEPVSATAGQSFEFYAAGSFTAMFSADTCTGGDSLSNNSPSCTVKAGAKSQANYPITLSGCKDGTGSLTVQ